MPQSPIQNNPSTPVQWPGVTPVQPKAVNKLGTLQVEVVPPKVSLPQKIVNSVKTALHLGKPDAPPPKVGLPPLPKGLVAKADPSVQLQAKQHTDAHQLPEAHLQDLPVPPMHREKVITSFQRLASFMEIGDTPNIERELGELVKLLRPTLDSTSTSQQTKLAFTLSDGKSFVKELGQAILAQASPDAKPLVENQLEHWMEPYLHSAFDQLVSGVLDKALKVDKNGVPTEIEVNGKRYARDKDTPLAQGNFGEVWVFTGADDKSDKVVLKRPLGTGSDEAKKKANFEDPLREGQVAVQVMGTGASSGQNATLLGVIRGEEAVNLIFRFESGGSMHDAMGKIESHQTLKMDPDVAQGKLGLMLDVVLGVQHMQESKGVVHLDLAMRNLLIDDQGHAKISDYGLSQFLPESGPVGQSTVAKDQSLPNPVQWSAPEVIFGGQATPKSDVYSLGVTLLQMAKGMEMNGPPWRMSNATYLDHHDKGTWDPGKHIPDPLVDHTWPGVDMKALRSLIVRMVDSDPDKRPTLMEVASSPVFAKVKPEHRQALMQVLKGSAAPVNPNPSTGTTTAYSHTPRSRTPRDNYEVAPSTASNRQEGMGVTQSQDYEIPSFIDTDSPVNPPVTRIEGYEFAPSTPKGQ